MLVDAHSAISITSHITVLKAISVSQCVIEVVFVQSVARDSTMLCWMATPDLKSV